MLFLIPTLVIVIGLAVAVTLSFLGSRKDEFANVDDRSVTVNKTDSTPTVHNESTFEGDSSPTKLKKEQGFDEHVSPVSHLKNSKLYKFFATENGGDFFASVMLKLQLANVFFACFSFSEIFAL